MNNDWQQNMGMLGQQFNLPNSRYLNNFAPHYEVVQVTGRAGAENFRMGPNSSFLLLDSTAPIVWLVKTDGSGLLSATPYDYVLHQEQPKVDVNALAARVQQLEEELTNVRQSNARSNKQYKKQQSTTVESSNTNV